MLVTWLTPPVALGPQPGPQSLSVCPGWYAGAVTEGWQLGTRGEVGVHSSRLGRLLGSTLCIHNKTGSRSLTNSSWQHSVCCPPTPPGSPTPVPASWGASDTGGGSEARELAARPAEHLTQVNSCFLRAAVEPGGRLTLLHSSAGGSQASVGSGPGSVSNGWRRSP